jgi:hypothetical protein
MKVFSQVLFLLFLTVSLGFAQSGVETDTLGGYASKVSVKPGDSLTFYISTDLNRFNLRIYRWGVQKELVAEFNDLHGGIQPVPDSAYYYGCRWKPNLTIVIPANWKSGVYTAEFPTSKMVERIIFIVRPAYPHAKILFNISVNTYQVYNTFGGKSGYDHFSTDRKRSYIVSFDRPYAGLGDGFWGGRPYTNYGGPNGKWEQYFIWWLEKEKYEVDYCTDIDVDREPELLSNYKLLIIVGHSEYWSRGMRNNIENFVRSGGNLAIFSGNTCWWQIRYTDDHRSIICFKNYNIDPLYGLRNDLVTDLWFKYPVNDPPNKFLGSNYREGGRPLTISREYGGYTVYNDQCWVYNGTGLSNGDKFGFKVVDSINFRWITALGYEVDGTSFDIKNGNLVPNGLDGTPENAMILASVLAKKDYKESVSDTIGHGTIVLLKYGKGYVFNAGTTDWSYSLGALGVADSAVVKVTRNVINAFVSGEIPPLIVNYSPYILVTKFQNGEVHKVRRRDLILFKGQEYRFQVYCEKGDDISYSWSLNERMLGSSSNMLVFLPDTLLRRGDRYDTLTCLVSNGESKTRISWYLSVSSSRGFRITMDRDTLEANVGLPVHFSYALIGEEPTNGKSVCLEGPSWLRVDSVKDKLVGVPSLSDTGINVFKLIVSDTLGQLSEKVFCVRVRGVSSGEDGSFQSLNPTMLVYPNPAKSHIILNFLNVPSNQEISVEIFNVLGQRVWYGVFHSQECLVSFQDSRFSVGIYFISARVRKYDGTLLSLRQKLVIFR